MKRRLTDRLPWIFEGARTLAAMVAVVVCAYAWIVVILNGGV